MKNKELILIVRTNKLFISNVENIPVKIQIVISQKDINCFLINGFSFAKILVYSCLNIAVNHIQLTLLQPNIQPLLLKVTPNGTFFPQGINR